jgi:hypothetical protein
MLVFEFIIKQVTYPLRPAFASYDLMLNKSCKLDHCVLVCVATLTSLHALMRFFVQHPYRRSEWGNEGQ